MVQWLPRFSPVSIARRPLNRIDHHVLDLEFCGRDHSPNRILLSDEMRSVNPHPARHSGRKRRRFPDRSRIERLPENRATQNQTNRRNPPKPSGVGLRPRRRASARRVLSDMPQFPDGLSM